MRFLVITIMILLFPVVSKADTISFVGDSLAYGMASSGKYINGGIVGAGISTGNPKRNEKYWLSHLGDKTIIEIGTNDYSYNKSNNYSHLLDEYVLPITNRTKSCIVTAPLAENNKHQIRNGVKILNPILIDWATKHNLKIVQFPHFVSANRTPDGIHFKNYKMISSEIIKECNF